MTEAVRAMEGVELAVRRVAQEMRERVPTDMGLIYALDQLGDEISKIANGALAASLERS